MIPKPPAHLGRRDAEKPRLPKPPRLPVDPIVLVLRLHTIAVRGDGKPIRSHGVILALHLLERVVGAPVDALGETGRTSPLADNGSLVLAIMDMEIAVVPGPPGHTLI